MPDLQLRRATDSQTAVNLSSFMTRRSRDLQQLVASFSQPLTDQSDWLEFGRSTPVGRAAGKLTCWQTQQAPIVVSSTMARLLDAFLSPSTGVSDASPAAEVAIRDFQC